MTAIAVINKATSMDKWISSHLPNPIVKYTKGKLYLGAIDANRITYSKNPIGSYWKVGNEFKIGLKKSVRENSEGRKLKKITILTMKIHN